MVGNALKDRFFQCLQWLISTRGRSERKDTLILVPSVQPHKAAPFPDCFRRRWFLRKIKLKKTKKKTSVFNVILLCFSLLIFCHLVFPGEITIGNWCQWSPDCWVVFAKWRNKKGPIKRGVPRQRELKKSICKILLPYPFLPQTPPSLMGGARIVILVSSEAKSSIIIWLSHGSCEYKGMSLWVLRDYLGCRTGK